MSELSGEEVPTCSRKLWDRTIDAELNHRPRPCLRGQASCAVFFNGLEKMRVYTRNRRKQAYKYVLEVFISHLSEISRWNKKNINAAWRRAVKTWLLKEGIIAIEKPKFVTPLSLDSVS